MALRWAAGLRGRWRARLRDERGQALIWGLLLMIGAIIPVFVLGLGVSGVVLTRARAQSAADAAALVAASTARPQVTLSVRVDQSTCKAGSPGAAGSPPPKPKCSWSPQQTVQVSGGPGALFAVANDGLPGWASQAGCDAMASPAPTMPWAGLACISETTASGGTVWRYPDQGSLPYSNNAEAAAENVVPLNLPAGTPWGVVAFSTTQGSGRARIVLRVQAPVSAAFVAAINGGKPEWVTAVGAATPTLQTRFG